MIVALFPVVENMPGGGALRPGDVVRTLSGRTVEVLNTDAEGPADPRRRAASTPSGFEPEAIVIDVATLTGASAIVFGPVGIGFFSYRRGRWLAALAAGRCRTAGERLVAPAALARRTAPLLASRDRRPRQHRLDPPAGQHDDGREFPADLRGPVAVGASRCLQHGLERGRAPLSAARADGERHADTLVQFLIEQAGAGR